MEQIRISVSLLDILLGEKENCEESPVAQALRRVLNAEYRIWEWDVSTGSPGSCRLAHPNVEVGSIFGHIDIWSEIGHPKWPMGTALIAPDLQAYIDDFDQCRAIAPAQFDLEFKFKENIEIEDIKYIKA